MSQAPAAPGHAARRLLSVTDAQILELADLLIDCVQGGASVSFMSPLPRSKARVFWRGVAEGVIRDYGKSLLVLDTASRDAERLYARLGWQRCGVIPGYALLPHGGLCDTTVFCRELAPAKPGRCRVGGT